ncbi:Ribonucleotide reductase class II vitamin B12-dependent domain protein, partial [mine drainage metagenome]
MFKRHFTIGLADPYCDQEWEFRDVIIARPDGSLVFEQKGVEVPTSWSTNASTILAQKYFRGNLGSPERESSLRQIISRVVDTIERSGKAGGYFSDDEQAEIFTDELSYLLSHQMASFNSPVWFNIGVDGVPQQASACFILSVDDEMESILNWYREEGIIFKGGSGA